jgi:hypothetical protein
MKQRHSTDMNSSSNLASKLMDDDKYKNNSPRESETGVDNTRKNNTHNTHNTTNISNTNTSQYDPRTHSYVKNTKEAVSSDVVLWSVETGTKSRQSAPTMMNPSKR